MALVVPAHSLALWQSRKAQGRRETMHDRKAGDRAGAPPEIPVGKILRTKEGLRYVAARPKLF